MKQLLNLYPSAWRARYEDEFAAILEQHPPSVVDILDILWGALDAHLRPQVQASEVKPERRSIMRTPQFIRWSGLASALGSLLMILSLAVSSAIADKEYPYDEGIADVLLRLVFYFSMVLLLVGLLGHNARQPAGMGFLGRTGIVLAVIGVILVLASPIGYLLQTLGWYGKDDELTWNMMMLGLIITIIGATVYAAAGLRNGTLPRWAAAVTTIGGAGVIAALPVMIFGLGAISGPSEAVVGIASFALGVLFAIGWAWIGFNVWSARPETTQPQPPAPLLTEPL